MNWSKIGRLLGIIEEKKCKKQVPEDKYDYNHFDGVHSSVGETFKEGSVDNMKVYSAEDINVGNNGDMHIKDGIINVNKMSKNRLVIIILGVIIFYLSMNNIATVTHYLGKLVSFFSPFILGGAIAFIINVPMSKIENILFKKVKTNPRTRTEKIAKAVKRPISVLITLILVFGVIALALTGIVPQLVNTLESLADTLPKATDRLEHWVTNNGGKIHAVQDIMNKLNINLSSIGKELSDTAKEWATTLVNSSVNTVSNIVNGIVQFIIGLIFSIYVLMQKEKLGRQGKQVIYASFREKTADKIMFILGMSQDIFKGFISGQCVDAIVNGVLFFIAMTIFGFPYAVMISIVIGFMALIPIIGSVIGASIGTILILIVQPSQAMYFLIMYVVIQQIDGNIIYPQIAGNNVGLPSIWVLMAVTVGGSMIGVLGMVLFIPIASILYQLTRYFVLRKLSEKSVSRQKWEEPLDLDIKVLDK
ncbi:AI-2E family transporter [Eubacteriales bacterium KG127]